MSTQVYLYTFNSEADNSGWEDPEITVDYAAPSRVMVNLCSKFTGFHHINFTFHLFNPHLTVTKNNWESILYDCLKTEDRVFPGITLELGTSVHSISPVKNNIGYIDFEVKTSAGTYLYLLTETITPDPYVGVKIGRITYSAEPNIVEVNPRITKDGINLYVELENNVSGKFRIPFAKPLDIVQHANLIHKGAKYVVDTPSELSKLVQHSQYCEVPEGVGQLKPGFIYKDDSHPNSTKMYFSNEKALDFIASFDELIPGDLYESVYQHRHLRRLPLNTMTAVMAQFDKRFLDVTIKTEEAKRMGELLRLSTVTNRAVSAMEKAFFDLFDSPHPHSPYTLNL